MVKRMSWIVSLLALSISSLCGQVVINEFLASNGIVNTDPDFSAYSDWIELHNTGASPADIGGYYLSDDPLTPTMWQVPAGTTIPAGSFLLIWADKADTGLHTNFKLGASGESILLSHSNGTLLDSYTYTAQQENISMGRATDGTGDFNYFTTPTPALSNSTTATLGVAPEPTFSKTGGFYTTTQSIVLTTTLAGADIYYTTDGSEPTASSSRYTSPISIASNAVLRARVIHDQYQLGRVSAQSYFIGERNFDLPVVSLAVDPFDMFDETYGMYMEGPNAESAQPYYGANYWEDREEPVSFEYFDQNGIRQTQVNAGIKIFGGWSRAVNDQRSVSINCRESIYGDDRIRFKFFADKNISEFKNIVLRNAGNDQAYSMMRDAAMQAIVKTEMDLDYQAYQPAVVFINGEYWGIQNIREKLNEHYVEGNTGIPNNDVDFLTSHMSVSSGDSLHYKAMFDYAIANDLSIQSHYEYMETQMDVDEYINYLIAEIFFANADWPDNNIKFWHERTYGAKWRWILFDLDFGLGIWGSGAYVDGFNHAFGVSNMSTRSWPMQDWGTLLNENLIQNEEFKNKLIQRFSYHLNTTFAYPRTTNIIDDLASVIESEIPYHKDRWNQYDGWIYEISSMKSWVEDRPSYVKSNLRDFFGVSTRYALTVTTSAGSEKINLSGMDVTTFPFSESFFGGVPLYLEAIPKAGYSFSHWENGSGTTIGTDQELELTISSATEIKAVYTTKALVADVFINEILPDNKTILTDENSQYEDIIELYNGSSSAVDVGGLFLSDSPLAKTKWMIPNNNPTLTTIPAGDFLIIYADKDPLHGPLHADFKLASTGDTVILSQQMPDGSISEIDRIIYTTILEDVSYGHYPDGSGALDAFITPTPGSANIENDDLPITGLVINEFQASNKNTIADENGGFADWIEIYNTNTTPVDVGGLFMSDDINDPLKYRIPNTDPLKTTIAPKDYLLLWADGNPIEGVNHLDFNLSATSGYISLNQKLASGAVNIDEVAYNQQIPDISTGAYPNGTLNYQKMLKPTPGASNVDLAYTPLTDVYINEVLAVNTSGKKDELGVAEPWLEIHYGGSSIVNLAGLYLTDDISDPYKYTITRTDASKTTLSQGDKLCLWLDSAKNEGVFHTNFKITEAGAFLYLYQFDGTKSVMVDNITVPSSQADQSYGRYPDGDANLEVMPPSYAMENVSSAAIAYLSDLEVVDYNIVPAFSSEVFDYEVLLLPGTTEAPNVIGTAYNEDQTLTTTQATTTDGDATIKVVAQNGINSNTYTVSFSVALSDNSNLASIELSKGNLSTTFSPTTTSYSASFEGDNIAPVVSATAEYEGSSVSIEQATAIPGVSLITVTAEDGSQTVYTVEFTTGPAIIEGFTEDFNDNFNNGWEDSSGDYVFTESNGELQIDMTRTSTSSSWESMKYSFPQKIVDMTNYPYVSLKMKVPSVPTDVRVDLRDINRFSTNSQEIVYEVDNTGDYIEYFFDFTGRFFQKYPTSNQGDVDYTQITDLVIFFEPGRSGAVERSVIFEDVKIGKPAYKPEYDNRLASLEVEGHALFPQFDASIKDYTVIVDGSTIDVPAITAIAEHEGSTITTYSATEIPGTSRIRVTAEEGGEYVYYDVNFVYAPTVGCAGGQILSDYTGTITDGSGASAYLEYADCFWLIKPNLADSIILSFDMLDTEEDYDRIEVYDGENTSDPLIASVSGIDNAPFTKLIATSGAMLLHFISDGSTEADGWEASYYTVTKGSSDANISDLTILDGFLGQEFSSIETRFLVVANDASTIPTITPTLSDNGASFKIENPSELPGVAKLTVTAEDLSIKEYYFDIIVDSDLLKPLSGIEVDQYDNIANIILPNYLQLSMSVSWAVEGNSNIAVSIQNGVASFTPDPAWFGTEEISITASAGNISDTEILSITINEAIIPLEGITIPTEIEVVYPETYQFDPIVTPENTTEKTLYYQSSDESIATVSSTGKVTAISTGEVIITVSNEDKTVSAQTTATIIVCTEEVVVMLTETEIELTVGENKQLNASITPDCLQDKEILWLSSNEQIATVTTSGIVIPQSAGSVTIFATSNVDQTAQAQCSVTILEACSTEPATIIAEQTEITIAEGVEMPLQISVLPENVCDSELAYTSSDETIVKIVEGKLLGLLPGDATITVTNANPLSQSAQISVTVTAKETAVEAIALSESNITVDVGSSYTLTAQITPDNATVQDVIWSVSNSKATVSNGIVSALDTGLVTIKVVAIDGGYSDVCIVNIVPIMATNISLSPQTTTLNIGESYALRSTITPNNATTQEIIWSSTNESIVTVNQSGLIIGQTEGSAYIKTLINDGQNIIDSMFVSVLPLQVDSVVLSTNSISLLLEESTQVNSAVYPLADNQKDAVYSVKDETIATVSESGLVSGVSLGETMLYATVDNKVDSCTIIVNPVIESEIIVQAKAGLVIGEELSISVSFIPENTTDKSITWDSDFPTVASVDEHGTISALKTGVAIITATSANGEQAKCEVTVSSEVIPVDSISIEPIPTLTVGSTHAVNITVWPENATSSSYTWISTNESVATIENGVITVHSTGDATISITVGGITSTIDISTINANVTSISITDHIESITAGSISYATAEVYPSTAINKNIIWRSSNSEIFTTEDNSYTGKHPGEAYLIAESEDGGFKDSVLITVTEIEMESLAIQFSSTTIDVGSNQQLIARIYPTSTTVKDITWSSSNSSIISVTDDGNIKAQLPGTAYIYARNYNGTVQDSILFSANEVVVLLDSIGLQVESKTVAIAESAKLNVISYPSTASNATFIFTSSDPSVATISQTGLIIAKKTGKSIIDVQSFDGSVSSSIIIKVQNKLTEHLIMPSTLVLVEGSVSSDLFESITIIPEDAASQKEDIIWIIEPAGVISISGGNMYATKAGEATITAISGDLQDTVTIDVTININNKPTLERIAEQITYKGVAFAPIPLSQYVIDDFTEPSQITWKVLGNVNLNFEVDSNNVLWASPKDTAWNGSESVSIVAIDEQGKSSYQTLRFSISENLPSSVSEHALFFIGPNPVTNSLTIFSNDEREITGNITSMEGIEVLKFHHKGQSITIDVSSLVQGTYTVHINEKTYSLIKL